MMEENFNEVAASFPEPFRLLVRETVGSTNDAMRLLGEAGAMDGLVLLAHQQTAGRGRRGAVWFTPTGESLAFSVLVRPEEPKALWPRLALAAGVAVAEAIETTGVKSGIKWPNDVWIGTRKVAGILVEAGADFAVVGIGLNVNTREFPEAVAHLATSLEIESSRPQSRSALLLEIIRRFAKRRQELGSNFDHLISAVASRCVLTGRQVSLVTAGGPREGRVEGIGTGGELLLRTKHGLDRLIQADEIRLADC